MQTYLHKVNEKAEVWHTSPATTKCCKCAFDCSILFNTVLCCLIVEKNKSLNLSLAKLAWIGMTRNGMRTHLHTPYL